MLFIFIRHFLYLKVEHGGEEEEEETDEDFLKSFMASLNMGPKSVRTEYPPFQPDDDIEWSGF
jgi:hypothetical protein